MTNRTSTAPSPDAHDARGAELARWTAVAETVTGLFGHNFLIGLVTALRDVIAVDLALVTIGIGTPPRRARSVYALENGAPAGTIEYDLEGTPCQFVYRGQVVTIPCDLSRRFPKEAGFESYIGVPLLGHDGTVLGHLAVLSSQRLVDEEIATRLMRVFAVRAEAEYRREIADKERDRLIADLSRLSKRLAERYKRIHNANAFKTRILGMVAHDLRNHLATIVSASELVTSLLGSNPPRLDQARERCARIISGAERMEALIKRTLQQAREDSVAIDVKKTAVDLATVAGLAIDVNRPAAQRKGIALHLTAEPVRVLGDEDLLLEATDNLINNAIKYSDAGTAVHVQVVGDAESGVIRVADQGQGLSEDDLRLAFQEYRTLSARPTGGEAAVGLGLANVKAIAEAHGGRAVAESPGKGLGTTFSIVLLHLDSAAS